MLFFCIPKLAWADAIEMPPHPYWKDFVNMLITLFCILGLIMISIWALKKIFRSRMRQMNKHTAIKIIERRTLTPKSSLYLVNILGKNVVIAESQAGIQMITEVGQFEPDEEEKKETSSSFAAVLQKKMQTMFNPKSNVTH